LLLLLPFSLPVLLVFSPFQAILEIGVSAHYVDIFKVCGCPIGDGPVGAMGVASSSLILYEGLLKIVRSS